MSNFLITSTKQSVIERQKHYNVYRPEQFVSSPYISAYWSGHLIEELCEFCLCDEDEDALGAEAADCIIFLQNLTAHLYPNKILNIHLKTINAYHWDLADVITKVRKNTPDRKTWKPGIYVDFESWYDSVVIPILEYLLCDCDAEQIIDSFYKKQFFNSGRIASGDWASLQTIAA
jgi:hypothetical protein